MLIHSNNNSRAVALCNWFGMIFHPWKHKPGGNNNFDSERSYIEYLNTFEDLPQKCCEPKGAPSNNSLFIDFTKMPNGQSQLSYPAPLKNLDLAIKTPFLSRESHNRFW